MVNHHDAIRLTEALVVFNLTHCSHQLYLELIRLEQVWGAYGFNAGLIGMHPSTKYLCPVSACWVMRPGLWRLAPGWCQNTSLIMTILKV